LKHTGKFKPSKLSFHDECFCITPGPKLARVGIEPAQTEDVIRYSSFFSEMQTYQDTINSLLNESVTLLLELLVQTQNFIEEK
jgi:hypothetical protein